MLWMVGHGVFNACVPVRRLTTGVPDRDFVYLPPQDDSFKLDLYHYTFIELSFTNLRSKYIYHLLGVPLRPNVGRRLYHTSTLFPSVLVHVLWVLGEILLEGRYRSMGDI